MAKQKRNLDEFCESIVQDKQDTPSMSYKRGITLVTMTTVDGMGAVIKRIKKLDPSKAETYLRVVMSGYIGALKVLSKRDPRVHFKVLPRRCGSCRDNVICYERIDEGIDLVGYKLKKDLD